MAIHSERPPQFSLPEHWSFVRVERVGNNNETDKRWEIIDLRPTKATGDPAAFQYRYLCESPFKIRLKCASALVVLPLYTTAYGVYQAVKTPFACVQVFFQAIEDFLNRPGLISLFCIALRPPMQVVRSLKNIVRAPFYMIAMQFAALYGILSPIKGRKWVGQIECSWKRSNPPSNDIRNAFPKEGIWKKASFLWRACTDNDFPHPLYIAYSFQPLGTLDDPSIKSVHFSD